MALLQDLTGRRFGKLTAVSRVANDTWGRAQWHCVCECGGARVARADNLQAGKVTGCEHCPSTRLQIEAWYCVRWWDAEREGTAGFAIATRSGKALLAPEWAEARYGRSRQPAAVVACVRGLMQARLIRTNDSTTVAALAWLRRHKGNVVHHICSNEAEARAKWQAVQGK